MKKRVVKHEETQDDLLNASLSSSDSPNEQKIQNKLGPQKKTSKRRIVKVEEHESRSLFTELEGLENLNIENEVSVPTERVKERQSKKIAKTTCIPQGDSSVAAGTHVKKVKRTKSKQVINVGGEQSVVLKEHNSSPVTNNKKRVVKKTVKSSEKPNSSETVKKPSRKKTIKRPEEQLKPCNVDRGVSHSLTTMGIWEDFEFVKERIASQTLSNLEIQRREQYQETKRFGVISTNTGYVGELPFWEHGWLVIQGARQHNLKSIDVPFPFSAFTVVTGVSGSGKSSLVEDVLYRNLARTLNRSQLPCGACDALVGVERIGKVIKVDQAPIGQTPTSNAATYTGVFDLIRQLYAQLPEAKLRGYSPRRFSFNVPGGRCEKCEGAGVLKVEMHFLADVLITCDACGGKRYDSETLQVKYRGKSIADVLETTCEEALSFFERVPAIAQILQTLCDVGLDYLPLGQPATTLSGGEAQRIKLATELSQIDSGRTLYILDEPTTGLHFEDVRKLLLVLQRLVDLGNTVIVVEHNLDVIKNADWIVEVGPEAGMEGGQLVFAGTPEQLLEHAALWQTQQDYKKYHLRSYTGEALAPIFRNANFVERPVLDAREYWEKLKKSSALLEDEVDEGNSEETAEQPWEIDGRRWHTEFRTTRSGLPCKWEGRVLGAIVDRLEELPFLSETNWNNRTTVEIASDLKPSAWFMRANTCEEWLLRLKFRTAKNTFERSLLTRKLALRPLKEIEEIPLYGTLPRIKVETVGAWQEVELKVYSFDEINRPEFWSFLDLAVKRFAENVDRNRENEVDLTPWKTQGKAWHTSVSGFNGATSKPSWPHELLGFVFALLEELGDEIQCVWTNRLSVPYFIKGIQEPWVQVYTKNSDFLCIQLGVPMGRIDSIQLNGIGFEPEIERAGGDAKLDMIFLRFRSKDDFDQEKLKKLFKESYDALHSQC